MTYANHRIVSRIYRHGQECEIHTLSKSGTNEWGNIEHENAYDRDVIAFRTYPNRNTQIQSDIGERNQDQPVFVVPVSDDQPDPPDESDHIIYDGTEYEVKALTTYDTHVEFFGDVVINDV